MTRIRIMLVGLIGSLAIVASLAGATAASAGTHGPKAPTPACVITDPSCDEIVAAISGDPSQARNPEADTAATYAGPGAPLGVPGGAVYANTQNNLQDGTQDFSIVAYSFVPYFGEPSLFGFTNFDKIQYGGSLVALAEYTPFGVDTGLCARDNSTHHITLAPCAGIRAELFIVDQYAPGVNPAPDPYTFLLNVKQAVNVQHHLALTAPSSGNGPLTDARLLNKAPYQPSGQQWTAINS